jgi:hypothetical protein
MWNPLKKKKNDGEEDVQKMGMMQRLAMKKMMSMSPKERDKMIAEMMKPGNKDKIMAAMEMMKKTGQINDAQIEAAKKQFGL